MSELTWEITGPGREYDCYVFPCRNDEEHHKAMDFAMQWVEEAMDAFDEGGPELSVTFELRPTTDEDRELFDSDDYL